MLEKKALKEKLKKGPVFGSFINIAASCIPQVLSNAGMDFGIIDLEHAGIDDSLAEAMLAEGDACGLSLIIRPRMLNRAYIMRALDQGACGVEVPQIDTVEEAELAVKYGKYPPAGARGVAPTRATGFGKNFESYLKTANDDLLTIVHCETKAFLDILPDAVKVPGLDCIFLGPYDLSVSLGYPGELDHPVVKEAIAHFANICNEAGMCTGTYVRNEEDAKLRISQGFKFIAYAVDLVVLTERYKTFMAAM
ncbi:HpcH/HpaI aldolase family protein [Oceanidesulfovibrio marinus]|uniref:HpcH/HpaI aldolase/citrate lyase domain-containing protein n=1 Tax=Oceanidesulfovibrio marinus TaxID=370038 RepID=A0A6P1ZD32_9BACT|nr:aldolase/citrate lyase family protein [Oceanidesulfovibrio marinus]QJT10298.1 hypothetical protein E8L03_15775 [Oceanidesulfovibrio marinus]TVM32247.1 hypothetical protein DQK91_15300 [Oceanidesulfovibrio marinus]